MSEIKLHEKGKAKFVLLMSEDKYEEFLLLDNTDDFNDYIIVSEQDESDIILHQEIVFNFIKEKGENFLCLGGGFIEISDTEVFAYGTSKKYNTAHRKAVSKVLSEHIKFKTLRIEMGTNY